MWNLNLFYPYGEGTPGQDINIKAGAGPQWKTPRVPGSSKLQSALQGCFYSSGHMNFVLKIHGKKKKKKTKHMTLCPQKNNKQEYKQPGELTEKYFCKIIPSND